LIKPIKYVLTLVAWLCFSQFAWAALAVVNTPTALNTGTGGATLSVSFQCNAGTDFLTVGITSYNTVYRDNNPTSSITSATYNGVALTRQTNSLTQSGTSQSDEDTHIFTLVAPTTGSSQSLVVNYSPNVPFGGVIQPICWSGVNQSSPVGDKGSSVTGTGSSPISDAITVTSGNYALDQWGARAAMTFGAGQTSAYNSAWGGAFAGTSYKQDASAMSITFSGTVSIAHSWIEIKAAGSVAPNVSRRRSQQ
jgi:hypothetical protein